MEEPKGMLRYLENTEDNNELYYDETGQIWSKNLKTDKFKKMKGKFDRMQMETANKQYWQTQKKIVDRNVADYWNQSKMPVDTNADIFSKIDYRQLNQPNEVDANLDVYSKTDFRDLSQANKVNPDLDVYGKTDFRKTAMANEVDAAVDVYGKTDFREMTTGDSATDAGVEDYWSKQRVPVDEDIPKRATIEQLLTNYLNTLDEIEGFDINK